MRALLLLPLIPLALAGGCAQGSSVEPTGGAGGTGTATTTSPSSTTGITTTSQQGSTTTTASVASSSTGVAAAACPSQQFATSYDGTTLTCATVGTETQAAVNANCSVYMGQRDGCSGCGQPPTKWGHAGGAVCANGIGVDDTCTTPILGGAMTHLFGLNTDGDVDDNDTLYTGFHCDGLPVGTGAGPCGPDEMITGISGNTVTCASLGSVALDYVRASCSLYFGWRDSCDACALAPTRWGSVGTTACDVGAGGSNTCAMMPLGGSQIEMLGVATGGDVNDDDKLYVGFACAAATEASTTATGSCPAGQFVVGIEADGTLDCESPAPLVSDYVKQSCEVFFGWSDSCNGCVTPPTKWGRVRDGFCENAAGANDTCSVATLGATSVSLFGLNPDGDVDNDDKFYVSFLCP